VGKRFGRNKRPDTSAADQALMRKVKARLKQRVPSPKPGDSISIEGVTVRVDTLGGDTRCQVFTSDERVVGSIIRENISLPPQ
jgi:hypothetical protein